MLPADFLSYFYYLSPPTTATQTHTHTCTHTFLNANLCISVNRQLHDADRFFVCLWKTAYSIRWYDSGSNTFHCQMLFRAVLMFEVFLTSKLIYTSASALKMNALILYVDTIFICPRENMIRSHCTLLAEHTFVVSVSLSHLPYIEIRRSCYTLAPL